LRFRLSSAALNRTFATCAAPWSRGRAQLRPGRGGALRSVGTSTVLTGAASRAIGMLLRPTGDVVLHRVGLPRSEEPLREMKLVEPIVVEVSADVAMDHGKLRHPVRFIRVRVDLTVAEVELPSGR